jgi:hypothetical protein
MKASRLRDAALLLPCVLLLLFSVTGDSIWMDEAQTFSSVHQSFGDFARSLVARGDAVSGMPLYFFLEFGWCRLFGLGEFALRSMNYVFAALALWGACRLVSVAKLPRWSLLLFAANPMFLYYMNEARPYAAMYACGLWALLFLVQYADSPGKRPLVGFFACLLLGCALHMMFVFAGFAYLAFLGFLLLRKKWAARDHLAVWLAFAPFFALLGLYWMRFAFGAPELGFPTRPLSGIIQIVYSFAGLGGLGWSRTAFRDLGLSLSPRIAIELSAAALAYLAFLVACVKAKVLRNPRLLAVLSCLAMALLAFLAANIVLKTRFWERHVIYLVPAVLFAVALAGKDILRALPGWPAKCAVAAVVAVNFLSGFNIVALDEFKKEDYHAAVRAAQALSPDHVFFQGSRITFRYYGLRGTWSFDTDWDSQAPIEGNVNISTATREELLKLLARTRGRTVLLLFGRPEYDEGRIYRVLADKGKLVGGFAVVDAADIPDDPFSTPEAQQALTAPTSW